jgi:Domain of unknown function (DUF6438)
MKIIPTLFTFFILNISKAQKNHLFQVWVGDSLEYLSFDSANATFQFSGKYGFHETKGYHILGDTLRLQDWFTSSKDKFKTQRHTDYDYLMRKKGKTLWLKPINNDALELAGNREAITYKPIQTIYKNNFDFDSLKFSSTLCYGECPEMNFLIKEKEFFFWGGTFAIKKGNYKATLPDSIYGQLKDHLRKSAIQKIINWQHEVHDAPYYTLTIFSGKNKKIIEGYQLPVVTKDLIKFLLALPRKIETLLK